VTDAADLGALTREQFVARLGDIAENSPWVAEAAWELRPFVGTQALIAAFQHAITAAPAARQLDLVRAHPDLAGKAALAGDLTDDSRREQASAGLDRLTADELATFTRLNDAYRARFGFPFVVCVGEHTKQSILAAYERRLANDADTELATAVGEVAKIVALRLGALA
jgi:2-oxo-4-hydroxy-4-carboxy-5-ureidoimidazoline decarboxylase